jgi:hypothetical protein
MALRLKAQGAERKAMAKCKMKGANCELETERNGPRTSPKRRGVIRKDGEKRVKAR